MSQIKKEDINEENIFEVLEKAGIEFDEAELVSNKISESEGRYGPADFVVILDGIYRPVEILDHLLDDDTGFLIYGHYCAISVHRDFSDDCGTWIVLSVCEDSKVVWKTYGSVYCRFHIRSLEAITLD